MSGKTTTFQFRKDLHDVESQKQPNTVSTISFNYNMQAKGVCFCFLRIKKTTQKQSKSLHLYNTLQ